MPELEIRLGGYQAANSVHTRALHLLAGALRESLGGRVKVTLTESVIAHGRRADDLLVMTESDETDICYFSSSYLTARVPLLETFDRPFQFSDREHAYALLDGAMGDRLRDAIAAATGFRALGFWDNGFRHISNGRRPLLRPADCAGLRIRTLDNAMHQALFRRLGFEPVFVDVKDLVKACADGTVDAQENPLTNIYHFGLHRHHRHVSLTAHLFGVAVLLVNRRRFDDWPAEIQDAIRAAATAATLAQRREAAAEDAICLERLKAEGAEIAGRADIDRAAFVQAAAAGPQ